ncbi:MAG: indole-3-glycerol phosphate synthase TrpC [Verrucomicrobiae bacterium]|nr:indole-3-glycerol phosphate synthase TrpC [Verrucomicrobiae bacterium]
MSALEAILRDKRVEVAARKKARPESEVRIAAGSAPPPRDFLAALRQRPPALIAEVKRRSPSAGIIRPDFDPRAIARAYERAGASAISVLTDEKHFDGSLETLRNVRDAVHLPCLQKDFIVDPFQIWEARSFGADAVLLIVAALDDAELRDLYAVAAEAGIPALVEVHNQAELDRALKLKGPLVGINNRDLAQMVTSLTTTAYLIESIPDDRLVVSESGIQTRDQVQQLRRLGVDAILVGESLLKQEDLELAVRELMGTA